MKFDPIRSPITWRRIIANRKRQLKREVAWPETDKRTTEPKTYEHHAR